MHRSIATVSLSGTLRQKLEAIAAAGFNGIELFEPDFIQYRGGASEVRALLADLNLSIDLYQPFRDFEGMPDALHRRNLERAERKFDLMQALGADLMLVCSSTAPATVDDPARAAAQLHELAAAAARRGLRIGFEALAWGRYTARWAEAWRIVQQGDHPALGLILDSFHTLSLRDDPAPLVEVPGERIFFIQMADAPLLGMDVLQWARHHRNFPGQGQLDVAGFLACALQAGYCGPLSLEIFNDVFRTTPNRRTALDAMRSLLFLEQAACARLAERGVVDRSGAVSGQSVPLPGLNLFSPPPAPPAGALAFIEFGVDERSGAALRELFCRMGFTVTGQHRSKAVTRLEQGDICLLLNAEPQSGGRRRHAEMGTAVSVLGLTSADPAGSRDHALAFHSAPHEPLRGPDEQALPGIVAPGGLAIQFLTGTRQMDSDFIMPDALAAARGQPAQSGRVLEAVGLARVDHLALGLDIGQLDTWVLFARAVLGLEPGEQLELADPFGLIRSRGLANAECTLRLVLNTAQGAVTRTARQVSATGQAGGSVHHIAFSCPDLFASVAALQANGVRFASIPANYYEDLLARTDLDPDQVAQMAKLGIVWDRSLDGDYFHAYTEPFEDRFFLEIVQRTTRAGKSAGYDAYGALNAAVRLAGQEQERERSVFGAGSASGLRRAGGAE